MADRSIQHHPFELSHQITRQASTSSSDTSSATENKSTSSHPRRRRASPSSRIAQPSLGIDPESSRRRSSKPAPVRDRASRGPLANMSGSSDPAGEVTYTPTTHRVSKAKKGKKVHVCEHPGCGKTSRSKPQSGACIPMPLRKLSEAFPESRSAGPAYGKTVGAPRLFKESSVTFADMKSQMGSYAPNLIVQRAKRRRIRQAEGPWLQLWGSPSR
ncbi:MAG: hypothetical protein Q9209_000579 [Squamulea sp. 1 TL-2023]